MQLCGFEVGLNRPFILLAGPCVIESERLTLDIAGKMKEITDKLGIPYVFKASYDKANRSSDTSFRGLGMANGLRILEEVRRQIGVPVVTDVHTADEVPEVASVVDLLQTPAFLCRQTDFIAACAKSGKPVNIKKGQFLAPQDMKQVVLKARHACRGRSFRRPFYGLRARCLFRIQQPCVRYAQSCDHARLRRPGDFRCDAFRSAPRRSGHKLRRPQRICSSSGPRGCCGRCFRSLYGNAPESLLRQERRTEHGAAR